MHFRFAFLVSEAARLRHGRGTALNPASPSRRFCSLNGYFGNILNHDKDTILGRIFEIERFMRWTFLFVCVNLLTFHFYHGANKAPIATLLGLILGWVLLVIWIFAKLTIRNFKNNLILLARCLRLNSVGDIRIFQDRDYSLELSRLQAEAKKITANLGTALDGTRDDLTPDGSSDYRGYSELKEEVFSRFQLIEA